MEEIEAAYLDAYAHRRPSARPVVEMTLPTSLDTTLAPPDMHVAQLFVQYAPYNLDPSVGSWEDEGFKRAFARRVYSLIDDKAPGFSDSILGAFCMPSLFLSGWSQTLPKPITPHHAIQHNTEEDLLSPRDLERVFGLHGGSIFHGALSLHQLAYTRPAPGFSSYRSPLRSLYMCGAGTHPGGGVMGAPGRNCASVVLGDLGK